MQLEAPATADVAPQAETEEIKSTVSDAPATSETVETDEEKNTRLQAEEAARSAEKEKKRQSAIQRRMDELTAEKHEARRQFQEMMELNKQLLNRLEPPKAQEPTGAPQRDQFEDYEEYVTARATYQAEQRALQIIEQRERQQAEESAKRRASESQSQAERQFVERREQVAKDNPDFQEVIDGWVPNIPKSVEGLIVHMPEGPLLAYHMAKNPALERMFQGQPEYMHGVIIGQILSTLKSTTKESSAPAPAPTVGTKTVSSDGDYSGPPEGYAAWARKHMK